VNVVHAHHNASDASRAPSTSTFNLAHAIDGCTRSPNPQSVEAITFSRPTSSGNRWMGFAHKWGGSSNGVAWVTTPGARILPSGSLVSSHNCASCSWRTLAASMA
jgi:hypothetical protein